MNFSPNEPGSSPSGMGTIRTMQGDLKNIRASKNKVQPQPQLQPQLQSQVQSQTQPEPEVLFRAEPHTEQPKLQEINPISESFSTLKESAVKNVEKKEQEAFVLRKKISDIRLQTEEKTEKAKNEAVSVKKTVKKEEKKVLKPIAQTKDEGVKEEGVENEAKEEFAPSVSNEDKIQERIRTVQEKIRPIIAHKEVPAPENILAVSESENKAATQYAESLSKSAQTTKNEEKPVKMEAIEEESEYLPPELRLYRNTGTRAVSFKKEQASFLGINKPKAGISQINDNILRKTDSFSPIKKTGKVLKFAVLILIIAIGVYFIFIQKTDLKFFLQWLPKSPTGTPVLTISPTPASQDRLDIKNTIYIKDAENLNLELTNLKNQQNPAVSLVSYFINNTPITGEALLNRLNIAIPSNVKNTVDTNNVFLLYFGVNKRLGLAIGVKDEERLTTEMKVWEGAVAGGEINPIPYILSPLLLGNFFELNQNIVFSRGNYKEIMINYTNLPDSFRSVDYGIVKNFLVITTSKDDMFLIIDEVVK